MKSKIKSLSLFIFLASLLTLVVSCTININAADIIKCTITYDINMNNQTDPQSKEVLIGTKLSDDNILQEPEGVNGYKFLGWYLGKDKANGECEVKSNITLTAHWAKIYKITYVLYDNKTEVTNYTTEDEITLFTPENREGYKFVGWYETKECTGNKVTKIEKGTNGDKTYYARWELLVDCIKHKVTFNSDSNETLKELFIIDNTAINPSDIPTVTKEHYDFTGWYINENDKFDTTSLITSDITLTPKFTPHEYTITYVLYDNKTEVSKYTFEDEVTLLTSPSRVNYEFKGWYDNDKLSGVKITTLPKGTSGDKTYYAKWEELVNVVTYKVTFIGENGTDVLKEISVNENSKINQCDFPNIEQKLYYETKWLDGKTLVDKDYVVKNNVSVQLKYIPINFTIMLEANGGQLSSDISNKIEYTYETATFNLTDKVVREGYKFAGWYETKDCTGNEVTQILKGSNGNKTYYAKWEPIHKVEFTSEDGKTIVRMFTFVGNNEKITSEQLAEITKEHYDFVSWVNIVNNKEIKVGDFITQNLKLKPTYKPHDYTITYVYDDTKIEKGTYNIETPTVELIKPTKDDYAFAGWYENKECIGNKVTKIEKGSNGDKTYYARWDLIVELITHKVTFNSDSNEIIKELFIIDNTAINPSDIPTATKEHYDFTGWYINENDKFDTTTLITSDITLTQKFTPHEYTITYKKENGVTSSMPSTKTKLYGDKLTELDLPSFDVDNYYENKGWYNGTEKAKIGDVITTDITLTAKAYLPTVTITYKKTDEVILDLPQNKTVAKGYKLINSDLPNFSVQNPIYAVDGWYCGDKLLTLENNFVVTTDITLTAKSIFLPYTINYYGNKGVKTLPNAKRVVDGYILTEDDLKLPVTFDNYYVDYWYYRDTKKEAKIGDKITSDIVLDTYVYLKDITSNNSNFEHLGIDDSITFERLYENNVPVSFRYTLDGTDPKEPNNNPFSGNIIYINQLADEYNIDQLANLNEIKAVQFVEDGNYGNIYSKIFTRLFSIDVFDVRYGDTNYVTRKIKDDVLLEGDENKINAENEINQKCEPGHCIIGWKIDNDNVNFKPEDQNENNYTKVTKAMRLTPEIGYKTIKLYIDYDKRKTSYTNVTDPISQYFTNASELLTIEINKKTTDMTIESTKTIGDLIVMLDQNHQLKNDDCIRLKNLK